ncbi:MAG TPA: bifunctional YncE family protein/alkaline phosphatase family protein, partial [Vicinamibacteria bacterium]|nr:bifunctional YncE family protein/alkaline phosphatase family protein [Vicinamibacteria bacterium]
PPERPGAQGGGVTLLPNGWRIAPAGRHLSVGDLPLAMAESPDGRYLIVSNDGYAKPTLSVVDVGHMVVKSRVPLANAWLGLAFHPDGKRLYSSGAGDSSVRELSWADGVLTPGPSYALKRPSKESFVAGVAVSASGERVFAVHALGELLSSVDVRPGEIPSAPLSVALPAEGYTAVVSPDGKTVYVSLWGGARVLAFDAVTLAPRGEIAVGEHPSAMALSKDGTRLFVACANTNAVWVIDLAAGVAREQISVAQYPGSPEGSTPNGLGLSADGHTLLVASADNNAIAVVDVSRPGASVVQGFIPTGWYPTAVQFSRDGRRIYVLSGKGLTSLANPRGPQPGVPASEGQYSGSMLQGSLSVVRVPDAAQLAAYTKTVLAVTPYTDAARLAPAEAPADSPVPRRVGDPSPIKHVFYVIRENRTYDQILGDMEKGNGDPNLCLFGEEVTPNAHALAREFVLLDNFYVDAEVSYSGHAFSTGAYATDFVNKVWPMNYAHRGGEYLSEGGGATRNAYGNITAPAHGYIWDAAKRAGLAVRSYGEFATRDEGRSSQSAETARAGGKGPVAATVPGLEGLVSPDYPPWDLSIPDGRRIDVFTKELAEFEASGALPALTILRLGNDHTSGTKPGYPTPTAMIAENDLALGRLVEAISKSRYWKDSAIFVLEDDAQNGPDHVDAHRSVALVASPYARRGVVDSTLYTTSGMLRTIELVLGLPPMSQYDAAASPMYGSFRSSSVLTPFAHREAQVSLDEKNDASSPGAAASLAMDFEEADRAPDL